MGDKARVEALEARVKVLEKQRNELLEAFRKQMKLIDILKRQKVSILTGCNMRDLMGVLCCVGAYRGCSSAQLHGGGVHEDFGLEDIKRETEGEGKNTVFL